MLCYSHGYVCRRKRRSVAIAPFPIHPPFEDTQLWLKRHKELVKHLWETYSAQVMGSLRTPGLGRSRFVPTNHGPQVFAIS